MYVKGPDSPPLLNLQTVTSGKLRGGWQTGQLLKAFVVNAGQNGSATLEINGQQVRAQPQNQAHTPLKAGQVLQLEVMRTGEQPVLKVLNPPATQHEIMTRGVKQALPQQQPLQQVISSLQKLADSVGGDAGKQLKSLSTQILNQLPQLQQLRSGTNVKQAVENSGHFLEAKLRQLLDNSGQDGKTQLNQDMKANILRLLSALRSNNQSSILPQPKGMPEPQAAKPAASALPQQTSSPSPQRGTEAASQHRSPPEQPLTQASNRSPAQGAGVYQTVQRSGGEQTQAQPIMASSRPALEAQQQLESGIARIQFNQLQSIQQTDSQQRPSWLIDIPIKQADGRVDNLQIQIQREREAQKNNPEGSIWSVSLAFELQQLGAIRVGLTLVGTNQIGISLWADQAETVQLFNQHMDNLRDRMQEAGLTVGRAGVQQGVPSTEAPEQVFADNSLVDEQA
ncbi:MAG: flagellar hook-length control protein FliK [Gammaproteobacteria bacterium]|nr:flagellar hook-length control protein FliK [Gammaproteobacteria bacterium]